MKALTKLISLVLFFFSTGAWAFPAVGDSAFFELKVEQNGAYMLATYEVSIISKDEAGNFMVKTTITLEDNEPITQEQATDASQLLTEDQIKEALENCEALGGQKQQIEVAGQTLDSCKVSNKNDKGEVVGENFMALVPFGIAIQKEIIPDIERVTTIEIKKFNLGNN